MRNRQPDLGIVCASPPPITELRLLDFTTEAVQHASAALDIALVHEANRWGPRSPANARLAPNIWLIHGEPEVLGISARLQTILHHVHDISHGLSQWTLEGTKVTELLSLSCGLDFRDSGFPNGTITRTLFAGVPAILSRNYNSNTFDLYADSSLTRYISAWLDDAQMGL